MPKQQTNNSSETKNLSKALAGGLAGACSNLITQPFDVIKTNMIAHHSASVKHSMKDTTLEIYRKDGIKAFFRGSVPTMLRVFPSASIFFGLFGPIENAFRLLHNDTDKKRPLNAAEQFLVGALARTIAVCIVSPITIVKTRMEYAQRELLGANGGILATWQHIYKTDGVRGLYKGMTATIYRDVPYSGLNFVFYQQVKGIAKQFTDAQVAVSLASGSIAAVASTIVTIPFDVVRTRLQLSSTSTTTIPNSMFPAMWHIYQQEGSVGLFRGATPRLLKKVFSGAVTWTTFEQVAQFVTQKLNAIQKH